MKVCNKNGFTLLEILIALAIISIALTALLLTTAQTVKSTERLRETIIAHLVTTQAITLIQLDLAPLEKNQEITQEITLLGSTWYWHAKATPTHLDSVERLEITASPKKNGPFSNPLYGFRRLS